MKLSTESSLQVKAPCKVKNHDVFYMLLKYFTTKKGQVNKFFSEPGQESEVDGEKNYKVEVI